MSYRATRREIGNNVRKEVAIWKTVCLKDEVVGSMYICVCKSSLGSLSRTIRGGSDGDCGVKHKEEVWPKEQCILFPCLASLGIVTAG